MNRTAQINILASGQFGMEAGSNLQQTADGAVDWGQGLEYYNAARRLGKQVIFLSYPNEGHHLANEANQKDFLLRMQQYFDHFLKDQPQPGWMAEGIAHINKKYDRAD